MHLSHNATDLNLALNVTSIFDQHQDIADRQADLTEISSKFDEIALAMAKQQQELLNQKKDMKNEFKRRFNSFSLGVVFWELATGCVPYEELDEATISQGVKAGERLEIPNDVPPTFASIISNAWSQEPSKRPTAQQLIEQIITISPATKETPVISKFSPTPVLPNASSSTMLANYSIESAAVPVTDTSNKGM
ncbi:unnamed protein product [Rotaria sordida]|uniref:Protein kinase domain-containing protein n=1 Tax=Rotaria sordida TaxID=392033 RepID=A0A814PS44_9BILA|nr:unnamed protein product [Rotaria sordida]CAF1166059.1 unnamed protein product [Rotaria sordida]